ncbi:MAG: hypothetical protein FDZ69_10755, partial [Deltaproteobacteria bacterium]
MTSTTIHSKFFAVFTIVLGIATVATIVSGDMFFSLVSGVLFIAAVIMGWPNLAIYGLAFSLPFEGIPLMENLSITRFVGVGAVVVFVMLLLLRRLQVRFNSLDILVGVYFLVCVTTIFWAVNTDTAIEAAVRLAMIMVLYLILANFCVTPQRVEGVFWAYAAGAVLSIIIAMVTGRAIVYGDLFRLLGTVGDPNEFVQCLSVVFPFVAFASQGHPRRSVRIYAYVATSLFCVATILSGSRSGFLWLSIMILVLMFHFFVREKKFGLVLPVAVVIVVSLYLVPAGTMERLWTIVDLKSEKGVSTVERLSNYRAAWNMMLDNPMGVGLRNFKEASENYGVYQKGIVVHNTFLEIGTGVGFVGLALFVSIIIYTLINLKNIDDAKLRISLLYGFLGYVL